jgi:HEAT repeat protein
VTDAVARAADLARLGLAGGLTPDQVVAVRRALTDDPDARVRASALGALVRAAAPDAVGPWRAGTADADDAVRRRAAELGPLLPRASTAAPLVALLDDHDVTVVEAAAWALGETTPEGLDGDVVGALARVAVEHRDALAREAAVAALGAIGDARGLHAVLHACTDRAAVRRRAVLALAPFDGPDVDATIAAALDDKDWQVRQAAEDLCTEGAGRQS